MRKQFYQKLKDPKFKGARSTRSVIVLDNLEKAKTIYKKASNCGKSNLYRVKKVKIQ